MVYAAIQRAVQTQGAEEESQSHGQTDSASSPPEAKPNDTNKAAPATDPTGVASQFREAVTRRYSSVSQAFDAFREGAEVISRAAFMRGLKSLGMGTLGKEERRMLRRDLTEGKQISRSAFEAFMSVPLAQGSAARAVGSTNSDQAPTQLPVEVCILCASI